MIVAFDPADVNTDAEKFYGIAKMLFAALSSFHHVMMTAPRLWEEELLAYNTAKDILNGDNHLHEINGKSTWAWADAIAHRIADEHSIELDSEEYGLLYNVLFKALLNTPSAVEDAVGTIIIEDEYFEEMEEDVYAS